MGVHPSVSIALCLVWIVSPLKAQDFNSPSLEAAREQFCSAASSHDAGRALQAITSLAEESVSGPREYWTMLKQDQNDGIALFAMWRLCDQRILVPRASLTYEDELKVENGNVQRFVGFAEGRLRINSPVEWQLSLPTRSPIPMAAGSEYGTVDEVLLEDAEVVVPLSGCDAQNVADGVEVKCFDRSAKKHIEMCIPTMVANELRTQRMYRYVAACTDGTKLYVAFCGGSGSSYMLGCFRGDGTLAWTSRIWSAGMDNIVGATPQHQGEWASVFVSKGKVYVFGDYGMSNYIEVFDAETGNATLRIDTDYWRVKPDN